MFLVCQQCNDLQVAAYLVARYAAGRVAVTVFPHGPMCRIVAMTTAPCSFAQALQHAVEAAVEKIVPVAVVVPAARAAAVARVFSSTNHGLTSGTVEELQNGG